MSTKLFSIAALFLSVSTCHDHSAVQSIRLKALVPSVKANSEAVSVGAPPGFLNARIQKRMNQDDKRTVRGAAGLLVGGTAGAVVGTPVIGGLIGGVIGAGATLAGDGIASKLYNRYHIHMGRDEEKIANIKNIADRAELLEGLIATYVRRSHNIKVNINSNFYDVEKKQIRIWKQYNHARGDNGDAILRKIQTVLDQLSSEGIRLSSLPKSDFPVLSEVVSISEIDKSGFSRGINPFNHALLMYSSTTQFLLYATRFQVLKDFLNYLNSDEEKQIISLYTPHLRHFMRKHNK